MIASSSLFRLCYGWLIVFAVLVRPLVSLETCVNSNEAGTCDDNAEPTNCGYEEFDSRYRLKVGASTCSGVVAGQQSQLNYSLTDVDAEGDYDDVNEYMQLKVDFVCLDALSNETVYKKPVRAAHERLKQFSCASNDEVFSALPMGNIKCYIKSCARIIGTCNLNWFSPIPIECNTVISPDVAVPSNTTTSTELLPITNQISPSDVPVTASSAKPSPAGILPVDTVTTMTSTPGDPTIQPTTSSSPSFHHPQTSTILPIDTTAPANSDYLTTSSSESSPIISIITSSPAIPLWSTGSPASSSRIALPMTSSTICTSSTDTGISTSSTDTYTSSISTNSTSTETSLISPSGNSILSLYLMLSITVPVAVVIIGLLCIAILSCFIINKRKYRDSDNEEKGYQTVNLDLMHKSNDTLISLPSVVTLVQELQYSSLMTINNEDCLYSMEDASKLQSAGTTPATITASKTSMHLLPLAVSKAEPMGITMSASRSLPYLTKGVYMEDEDILYDCETSDSGNIQQTGTLVTHAQQSRMRNDLTAKHQSAIINQGHGDCDNHSSSYFSGEYKFMMKDADGYVEMQQ